MNVNQRISKTEALKRRLYFGLGERERIRISIQFSIMIIASSVMGIIFAKYFISGLFVARNSSVAVRYFNNALPSSKALLEIVNHSKLELMSTVVIMLSAFGRFNYFITDIVLVIRGFYDSFLCIFLFRCVKNEFLEPNISILDFTVCFLSKSILLLLFYAFSYRICACSLSIKRASSSGLRKVKNKSIIYAVFLTLREIFTIIFINGIALTIIFLIK